MNSTIKRVLSFMLALTMVILCIPFTAPKARAANISNGSAGWWVVGCFVAQTGENMPRRQQATGVGILPNSILDSEGNGIGMQFVEEPSASIQNIPLGQPLTADKINLTNSGKYMWAYCIQKGTPSDNGDNRTAQTPTVNAFWNGLGALKQRGIEVSLLCGFPSSMNLGGVTSWGDLYAATQAVIWEFQTGKRTINITNGKYNGTTLSNSEETKYFGSTTKTAYNALVAKINTFLTQPVIAGNTYNASTNTVTLKWNSSTNRYEAVVTDSKNVLSNYMASGSSGNINWTISGNKMTLYTTSATAKNVSLSALHSALNSSTIVDQSLLVMETSEEQRTVAGCNKTDPLPFGLRASVEDVGNLTITKNTQYGNGSNYGGDLSGWKFTVEGYAGSTKVSTNNVTTGSNGKATLNNLPLYSGTTLISYRITETGNTNTSIQNKYLWNATGTVSTTLTAPTSSGVSTTNVNYANKLKMGKIELTKYYENDGQNYIEPGAVFQIYINSAASYDAANANWRDTITTGANGRAVTKDLPYGTYIVHQTVAKEGTRLHDDFTISITENGQTAFPSQQLVNKEINSYIKVVKVDRETGLVIPLAGAEFEIYDSAQNLMSFRIYNGSTFVDQTSFTTDAAGFIIIPEKLKYGTYYVKEINAPTGYVLDSTMRPFTVSEDSDTRTEVIGTITYTDLMDVNVDNIAQKGTITVYKKGEMLTHVSGDADTGYIPEYGEQYLANAVFEVRAAEDITTGDGTVRAAAGELVATLTTNADGKATTGELYLGKYTIKEVQAPAGYVLGNIEEDVVLEYAGQTVEVTSLSKTYSNDRQKVEFNLLKDMEIDDTFGLGENGELQNVVFALYAKNEITAVDGTTIPANGLIHTDEPLVPDANGNVSVNADLPIGTYYFKEIATDEHYVLDTTEFTVAFEYQGQNIAKVYKTANNGEVVMNNLIRGQITIYKINEDDVPLEGVEFGLYSPDDVNFENPILTQTTDADGIAVFSDIPYGNWIIREISTLEGYIRDETATPHDITTDGQSDEQTVVNDYLRVYITKVNEEDTSVMLTEAEFTVYADSNGNGKYDNSDEEVTKFVEDDVISGLYSVKGLHYGTYFVKETKAPYGYNLDQNAYKIVINADSKDFYLSNENTGLYFTNKPIRGGIAIDKYDSENKDNKLDGAEFTLYEAVQAEVENELGTITLVNTDEFITNSQGAYYGLDADADGVIDFVPIEDADGNPTYPGYKEMADVLAKLQHDATVAIPSALKRALVRELGEYFRVARIKLSSGDVEAVNDYVYLTVGDYRSIMADEEFSLAEGISDDYVYMIMPVNYEDVFDGLDNDTILNKMTLVSDGLPMLLAQGIDGDSITITQILHKLVPGKEVAVLRPQGDGKYELRDILFGDYFIRETKAPEGFLIDDEYYLVTIMNQDEIVNITNDLENLGFSNVPITGTFTITKLDAVDGKPIPNAGFRIRDIDGNIVAEGYTDENGEFSVTLRYGKYTYEEFDAPEGYLLSDEIGTFEILEDGQIVKATMSDERIPDTGDVTSIVPVVVLMTIAAAGIIVFTKRKENVVSE